MADTRKKIALVSNDTVGKTMAGPGIRYFELAKALANHFEVKLLAPDHCDIKSDSFKTAIYNSKRSSSSLASQIKGFDYVIAQSLRPPLLRKIKKQNIKFIADLYDPIIIEILEYTKTDSERTKRNIFNFCYHTLMLQLHSADHILCSSDRQKDFYLGLLSSQKLVSPKRYCDCPNLNNLISILPFGLPNKKFEFKDDGLMEEKFKNIKPRDTVVYWGGGIWNWFDPMSAIKAIEDISKDREDIKLFFLGTEHPNPKIKAMETAQKALDYCKEKDLLDKYVFFNFGWTPYDERINYLGRANIGISTHFNNLETRFSFRTRVLDFLWAKLPIIATEGDLMAELVAKHKLGEVVRYENISDIKKAILKLADDKELVEEIKNNAKDLWKDLTWDKLIENTAELINSDSIRPQHPSFLKFLELTFHFYLSGSKKKLMK